MIHFTVVDEIKIDGVVFKCEPRSFKTTMDMIYFISEFQCTPNKHLYIYGVGDYPTGVVDHRVPFLNYVIYEIGGERNNEI